MIHLHTQIVTLAKAGHPPSQVAKWMNMAPQSVYYHLRKARLAGHDIPRFDPAGNVVGGSEPPTTPAPVISDDTHISVPNRLKSLLDREAERRGKTASELARDLLDKGLLAGVTQNG